VNSAQNSIKLILLRGQKAAVFFELKMAELPKNKSDGNSAFLLFEILCKKNKFL